MYSPQKRTRVFTYICATILMVAAFLYAVQLFYLSPFNASTALIDYRLLPGTSVKHALDALHGKGVLSSQQVFMLRVWAKLAGKGSSIQAGEYRFSLNTPAYAVWQKLVHGEVVQYAISFSEGSTLKDIVSRLHEHPYVKSTLKDIPLNVVLNESFASMEGLFFPDTYFFSGQTTDVELLKRSRHVMAKKVQEAWGKRDKSLSITSYEALILASIIEKEASDPHERRLVSGVFHRRLAKKMRLQADPTVSYGLNKSLDDPLTRDDLKKDTPYNTYLRNGLPPSPIASVSMDSIEAALHPIETKALYFVAKGDGTHVFSETLEEHNQAVSAYQRGDTENE